MKITTYNPDGSIKEVHQHHFQIPKYITSFDSQHSFLNIDEEDIRLVLSKGNSIEKDLILNKYRFLIKHDYDNYPLYSYQEKGLSESDIDDFNKILSFVIHPNRIDPKHYCHNTRFELLWVYTILFHAIKIKNRTVFIEPERVRFNNLINFVNKLYHCLRKNNIQYSFMEGIEQHLIYTIYPFTNIQTKNYHYSCIFDDDEVLVKVMEALYRTNGKCRESIFALGHGIDFLLQGKLPKEESNPYRLVSMISKKPYQGTDDITLFQSNPTNEIENAQIELSKEEIVYLICHDNVGTENFAKLEDEFNREFDEYCGKNSEGLKRITKRQAIRKFRTDHLLPQQWSTFYYDSLDDLENQYKRHYENHKDLSSPFCYYYLLVDMCDPGNRYEFKDDFLIELVNLAIKEKCADRCELYKQMFRLNYMEESAYMIPIDKTDEEIKEPTIMERLRNELLVGEKSPIVKDLLHENIKFIGVEDAINRILVFLTPLYDGKYMVKSSENDFSIFRDRLEKLLKRDEFAKYLEPKEPKTDKEKEKRLLGFNVKIVLNIIGVLSKEKDKAFNNPLKDRIADSLCKALGELWYIRKNKGYNSYINKYLDNEGATNKNQMYESFSLLDDNMIKTIKEQFSV